MANLFDILKNLQPTAEEIQRSELFSQQFLESNFPDMDFRQGTAIRDLTVRPTASLIALISKGLEYYFDNYTLKSVTDTTPENVVDDLMSNLFLYRRQGTKSVLRARLFFAVRKSTVISQGLSFSPDNVLQFSPAQTNVYSADNMSFDSESEEYYIDIALVSQAEGEKYNVNSGSLLYFTNFDPYFLRGEILHLISGSTAKETNSQFVTRGKDAISTRNLINKKSIVTNILEIFPQIEKVYPVGYGHPEMLRDKTEVVTTQGTKTVHLGGLVDVYCLTDIEVTTEKYTTDSTGAVYFTGPVLSVERASTDIQVENGDEIPGATFGVMTIAGYSGSVLSDPALDYGLSAKQSTKYKFSSLYRDKSVTLVVTKYKDVTSVQSYLEEDQTRVVCAGYLARSFNTYYLTIALEDHIASDLDRNTMKDACVEYIKTLQPGDPFIVSDLISTLYKNGAKSLKIPMDISYTLYNKNSAVTSGTISDILTPVSGVYTFKIKDVTVNG